MSNADEAIKRLFTLYGNPRTDYPDAFVSEYRSALGKYSPETLGKAIDAVRLEFKPYANQPWPAISDIIKHAKRQVAKSQPEPRWMTIQRENGRRHARAMGVPEHEII